MSLAPKHVQVEQVEPSFRPRRNRVAVVLNGNAKAVTERVIRDVRGLLRDGPSGLYVSRSIEESEFIARSIVKRGFDVVLCGGGDGTFSQVVSDITRLRPAHMPAFGVLRLGTGNAMASALGAARADRRGIAADLERATLAAAQFEMKLVEVEGKLTPFSGIGLDSLILSDYNAVKKSLSGTFLRGLGEGGAGYATAIATRSLWRFVAKPLPEVIIRNEGAPAEQIDLQGRTVGWIQRGGIIHRGRVAIAAASAVPSFGFDFRLFPQVELRRDRFQLRVGNVSAYSALTGLPALFRGTFDHPHVHDFFCDAVSIELPSPTPLQIGGDEVGERERVHMSLAHVRGVRGSKRALPGQSALDALAARVGVA